MNSKLSMLILISGIILGACDNSEGPEPEGPIKDCVVTSYTSNVDGELYGSYTVTHTIDGLINDIQVVWADGLEGQDEKTSFIYDGSNHLTKIEYFMGELKTSYYAFKYGKNIIRRHRYYSGNGTTFTLTGDSIQFILKGTTISSFVSYYAGVINGKEVYQYDAKGNVKKVTEYNSDGTTIYRTYTVEYQPASVNPQYVLKARGLENPNYLFLSPQLPTKVNGVEEDHDYNDDGYVAVTRWYNMVEHWSVIYQYECKD